jgi:hypothetical protein
MRTYSDKGQERAAVHLGHTSGAMPRMRQVTDRSRGYMTDPFLANIEVFDKWMRLLVVPLSIATFFIGRKLGQIARRRDEQARKSTAEIANHYYAKGYSAAQSEACPFPVKLEIVGGNDIPEGS